MGLHHCWRISLFLGTLISAAWLAQAAAAHEVSGEAPTAATAGSLRQQEAAPVGDAAAAIDAGRPSTAALLPDITRFWLSVQDLDRLKANLSETQMGKLAQQDTLAPFFGSFEAQIRESLNNNGIKLGIDLAAVEGMATGEISFGSVLPDFAPGEKPLPSSHGIVVLIDVSPDIEAARAFLKNAADKMKQRDATMEKVTLFETEVSKWTVQVKNAKIARKQSSFIAIVDGWLLASDSESIFTNVLKRVRAKGQPAKDALANLVPFQKVRERTKVDGIAPDLEWFVDPIGYARFADAIAEDGAAVREPKNRPLEALAKEGLDALEAAGGFVSFSTDQHDALHRTLIYANKEKAKQAAQKRIFELLDFAPQDWSVAKAPDWIPEDAAGYFSLTWDIDKAFNNVGPLVDAIAGQEGTFDKVLEEMKQVPDFQVDLRKMVQSLGKRVSVVVKTAEPINEASEKMLVGIELQDDVDNEWLIQSVGRALKGKVKKLAGFTYVIDDRTEADEPIVDDDDFGPIEIDIEDDEEDEDEDDQVDPAEAPPRITVFNRRFILIRDGVLFICNDKDYLKEFISQKPAGKFGSEADFTRMSAALDKLTDVASVRFRMFNRLDQLLKTNYEMMRTGKMAQSETLVGRILNQVYGKKAAGKKPRSQQIDGSKLPADYEKLIAPSLGQSGWAMETTDVGWRISGCLLPKAPAKATPSDPPAPAAP